MDEIKRPKARRGFAAMSPEKRREIAAKGGRNVSPDKRAFSTHAGLAESAGYKGGLARPRKPQP